MDEEAHLPLAHLAVRQETALRQGGGVGGASPGEGQLPDERQLLRVASAVGLRLRRVAIRILALLEEDPGLRLAQALRARASFAFADARARPWDAGVRPAGEGLEATNIRRPARVSTPTPTTVASATTTNTIDGPCRDGTVWRFGGKRLPVGGSGTGGVYRPAGCSLPSRLCRS